MTQRTTTTTTMTMQPIPAALDRLSSARADFVRLQQSARHISGLIAERQQQAATLRAEHDHAERQAQAAADALGRALGGADLGEVDEATVQVARDQLYIQRDAAERLRPRLDEATQADGAANVLQARLDALRGEIDHARVAVRAASSMIIRTRIEAALDDYDRAATETVRTVAAVQVLSDYVHSARRFDLFNMRPVPVTLPPLEDGRKPSLNEQQRSELFASARASLMADLHALGVDLEPGAADPWTMAH